MNVTIEKQPKCTAKITAIVPAAKVAESRAKVAKSYANEAKLPGFRPGKAPIEIITKRFAKEITEELHSRLINEICSEVMGKDGSRILNIKKPQVADFNDAGDFSFEAIALESPEFTLPEYKGLELKVPSEEVAEKDVETELQRLSERFAEYKETERGATESDFAIIDYTATLDGKSVAEVLERPAGLFDGRDNHWLSLSQEADYFAIPLEVRKALLGKTKDSKCTVSVTLPEKYVISDLSGKTVEFDISVKEIREKVMPELNDEFVAKFEAGKTFEQFKADILERLKEQKKLAIDVFKREKMIDKLKGEVDFEVAEEMLEGETARIFRQNIYNEYVKLKNEGKEEEEIIETIKSNARKEAIDGLKSAFILMEIAKKEEIQLGDFEVVSEITRLAKEHNEPDIVKFSRKLHKNGEMQNLEQSLLFRKTATFLCENAKFEVDPKIELEKNY